MWEGFWEGISFFAGTLALVIPDAMQSGIHYAHQHIEKEDNNEMGDVFKIWNNLHLLQLRRK